MNKLFSQIERKLLASAGVLKVTQYGSTADTQDEWSDLDIGVKVAPEKFKLYFPATGWIESLGDVYAINQSTSPEKGTTRVVFKDLSRVDFTIATSESLFSENVLAPKLADVQRTLVGMVDDFRFEAIMLVSRLGRDDKLIGMHLLLGLEQKCLVLAMMLRDQEQGTVHHRHGGFLNEIADRVADQQRLDMPKRLLAACELFGELALRLDSSVDINWAPISTFAARLGR